MALWDPKCCFERKSPPGMAKRTKVEGVGAEGGVALGVVPSPSVAVAELGAVAVGTGEVWPIWQQEALLIPPLPPACTAAL